MARLFLFLLAALSLLTASAQSTLVDHWETIVYDSSNWKYFPGTTDPGATWMQSSYNDTAWPTGKCSIGYGDDDDRTVISPLTSVFIRKKFNIIDKSNIAVILLHVDYDDGFVAYLNGTEIGRGNMGTGTPAYNQFTPIDHEASLYRNIAPDKIEVDKQLLLQGENVLSVEVHNVNETSSDFTASAFLSVGLINTTVSYGPVPAWFIEPASISFPSSNLPIIVINTHGQLIQDEPQIAADMGIIDNGPGNRNSITDPFNDYNGKISIEVRGESSQMFPKKSWKVETVDGSGANIDVSLLGLPKENDWVLYAPYTDKTMLRDVLTYKLGRELGKVYASRFKFVEVVLNDEYQGVYVLLEKIKRDKGRVAITKLEPTDISGDNITGGYILRVDKIDGNDYPAWTPSPVPHLTGESNPSFQYFDPKGDELVTLQQNYIKDFIQQFESILSSGDFTDPINGYAKYIDEASFVDFMLLTELDKNIDGYVYSTYMYKDRDSKGGKLVMGPLWDHNLAYGNVDYLENSQFAPGWTYNDGYRMFWFRRLMQSEDYANNMKCRWTDLRTTTLSNEHLLSSIDSMATALQESQVRNYQRWPILGTYVWPNQYVGNTYADEINFLKNWITARLTWMDANMPGTCEVTTGLAREDSPYRMAELYPNPSTGIVKIKFEPSLNTATQLNVYNELGQRISSTQIQAETAPFWDGNDSNGYAAPAGLYLLELLAGDKVIFKGKVIKI